MLTDEEIRKFQEMYRSRFGKEISKQEALEQGVKLVRLMELLSNHSHTGGGVCGKEVQRINVREL